MRVAIAIMALLVGVYAAHAFGLGEGNRFGRLGALSKGTVSGAGGCSPTGFKFNVACNSQYATVLHF